MQVRSNKTNRLPRIDRDDSLKIYEDENAYLWAVSYSDFLMALMSFFILFYVANPSDHDSLIMDLADSFGQIGKTSFVGSGIGNSKNAAVLSSKIENIFSNMDVSFTKDKKSLVINFEDNIFSSGQYKLLGDSKSKIEAIIQRLKPYKDQINLYFIGHADNNPLRHHKTHIIADNFILSSLRASSLLAVAKNLGFSEHNLFIKASSSNERNSRSVSIRIEPHEGKI